ncbi:hypothetical protein EK21DRAFT_52993 [Setomelanomma holmii]|uniref:DUF7580 domain-containing protein n=1 Tax=Setomelanomma holmii TaxID=210430 RepID=A0A9P4HKP4_9PLEO|nr:hypothetical protein EK21DRAFT_52993 [Setomelanomma holmii]
MSGVEVAGLIFGVLPILLEAVKSYGHVADALHIFRHYSREVKSVSLQLKVHKGIFLNHCRLLLRLVEDEKDAEDMLDDGNDWRWTNKELNDRLNAVLKDNFELCRSIVEDTRDVMDDLMAEVESFDVLKAHKSKDEKFKTTIKRLQGAVKIKFNKAKYEKCLASLRDRNDNLSVLRSQIGAFQQQGAIESSALVKHKVLPDRFHSIQSASQKLHEALCSAWCCNDAEHRGHYAKLCLDAEVQSEVRLDLAISCQEPSMESNHSLMHEPPIWLYVQSMSMSAAQRTVNISEATAELKSTLPNELLITCPTKVLKKKASLDLAQTQTGRKKKRVHFTDPASSSVPPPLATLTMIQPTLPEFNLCQTKNICHYLKRNYGACNASSAKACLGYLETPCQQYKHVFYSRDKKISAATLPTMPEQNTIYSLSDVMRLEADDSVQVEDQLKLAHKTALSILQYNDTPWLADRWRLGNMGYFGTPQTFDEVALKTVHLSSQISWPKGSASEVPQVMEGVQNTDNTVSDEIKYGINNLPLFFLGVALLEIAHWKPLESKMIPRDQEDQVYTARRLAQGRAYLGPEYQKIAQKCLQCNFGFGTKLNSKSLQTAVYNDVVCELEGMIERLAV